ncbi:MAG TPA: MBL fold metallo-hydrolase [Methylomusa anaerophila]|uniref:MBL fold metallo-hydrolase n=1 Tax=Methylomusa anaerophila TaxID=1930071 RepID=UPI001E49CEB0|nr:MBL fold metallo-hydrolase [Methylomusa anaerophila]HML87613.1 MBL fold metallo-hydrolase [Methylomusa anaerophila]
MPPSKQYLIVDDNTHFAAIVDPTWELETIEIFLKKLDVHLEMILLTHSHFDHVNLVQPLVKKYKSQVLKNRTFCNISDAKKSE